MINNTAVDNKHSTEANIDTVYPITFSGATDSGGLPMFKVTLTYADGSSKELEYNVDYALVYDDVQEDNNESFNKPHLNGIKFLLPEYAVDGNTLYILRTTPFVQPVDFQIGRIDPEQIEKVADLSVLRDQELDNKIGDVRDEFTEAKAELQKSIDDKLPLAGGEVSGDVLFRGAIKLYDKYNRGASFISAPLGGMYIHTDRLTRFYFDDDFYVLNLEINEESNLGTESYPWSTAYIKKLNNGGTISIPEKVGTMALLEDLESKADKTELSNYLPLAGGDLVGKVIFDVGGTAGKNTPLIGVETASGAVPLIGAKTDDNGVLRDIAVIPKLLSDTFQAGQIHASFVGTPSNPVTRIHAKKIGTGLIGSLLTIPDGPGTIARLADIPDTYTKEELDAKFAEIPGSVDTYSKAEIDAKLSSVYKFKGSVANVEALPTDAVVGDTYNVEDTGANYAWDGSNWDKLSDTINLSDYATVDYVDDFYLELSGDLANEKAKRASEDRQLYNNQIVLRDMLNEKDENEEFVQLTTEAQTAIPAINELNEQKASKEDLAGYLPLSGGTMTGALSFNSTRQSIRYTINGITIKIEDKDAFTFKANNVLASELYFAPVRGSITTLGTSGSSFANTFTQKLNNGADLIVPTEGGTLARLEDLEGIGGGGDIGPELDVELKLTSWFYGFNSSDGFFHFGNISDTEYPEDVSCFSLTNQVYSGSPNISIVNRSYGAYEDGEHYSFTEEWFGPGEATNPVYPKTLGRANAPWKTLYVESLCAQGGEELLLPTEGGTLARVEDITAAIGDINTILDNINGEVI